MLGELHSDPRFLALPDFLIRGTPMASSWNKQPRINRAHIRNIAAPPPDKPGRYFWSEYGQAVDVYRKKGGRHLYVVPPIKGGIEIRITERIAGIFTPYKEQA